MISQEIYLEKETFFHGLDPRTKLFTLVTFFVIILYFENPLWIAPLSFLVLMHGLASRSMANLRPLRYILLVLAGSSVSSGLCHLDGLSNGTNDRGKRIRRGSSPEEPGS